ncbi:unnamed protein product [Protopolystoma xenopodis]|uniref:Uncharacterized protein n=1 Tax=Protopolystoma xenopodis TaxID=117903 RepID=A0A448X8I5_9PLAT|nr:unnamed protein product [Protopolystoma xenopodis]
MTSSSTPADFITKSHQVKEPPKSQNRVLKSSVCSAKQICPFRGTDVQDLLTLEGVDHWIVLLRLFVRTWQGCLDLFFQMKWAHMESVKFSRL